MKRRVALATAMLAACAGDPLPDQQVGEPGGDLAAPPPWPGRTGAPAPDLRAAPFQPGEAVILITDLVAPQGLAVDGMTVYYTDVVDAGQPQSVVLALAKSGGNPSPIAADDPHAARVAVDDLAVYWTDVAAGRVLRADKLGGATKVLVDRIAGP